MTETFGDEMIELGPVGVVSQPVRKVERFCGTRVSGSSAVDHRWVCGHN